jgi:hypothetical protein
MLRFRRFYMTANTAARAKHMIARIISRACKVTIEYLTKRGSPSESCPG